MRRSEVLESDFLSTTFAATALSIIWHGVWLGVFFFSTWLANIGTSKKAFIMVLLLSAAAESIVRYSENAKWIANLVMRGGAAAGTRQHNFDRTLKLVLIGLILVLFFKVLSDQGLIDFTTKPSSFFGLESYKGSGQEQFDQMLLNWKTCLSDPAIIWALIISVFLRAIIYKRSK